ncbi:MAG: SRPBCC domain-containing protein [Gemmatimonadaceae bacterium]|nr:SRPBCC domain-containing protein [Gemmatimonadaceae bacterium]
MGNTDFRMERHVMIFRRRFQASRMAVYTAWTDASRLAKWFGPLRATNTVGVLDASVGGAWRVVMHMPDAVDYPLKGVYAEIVPGERLVFTMDTSEHPDAWQARLDAFRDTPTGARAGGIVTTVTFVEVGEETEMTVALRFDEASDRDAHYHMGAPQAWGESLDRLERLLAD